MYRPTVRYHDIFKEYVDEVFKSTILDRNQIFRLALFHLATSEEGQQILKAYSKAPLPSPRFTKNDMVVWYQNTMPEQVEGGTSKIKEGVRHESETGSEREIPRSQREVHQETEIESGVVIRVGNSYVLPRREKTNDI